MMQSRPIGRTGVRLSVVGFGTAQLQMIPERQAVETLVRGFELGVNWVHTAPDYGGIDPWIQKAIEVSGREVMVLSAGPPLTKDLPAFFENTCHVYKTRRLALYGLAGIEDIEWHRENLWGSGGMVEYLQARKAEGRLGGIYCSTHAKADYVARLVESGVFDAIMVSWNPLGFHQQSHAWARAKIGRDYEDLTEYRERIFPLAAERGVSLLIMKPFAGGLLCRSKALPPHDWFADSAEPIVAADVLRLILEEPGVCAVVPGTSSVEEAEENARAGHAPLVVSTNSRASIARAVASMRTSLCSRCGKCETTCSRSLAIPAMFRDAYIWTSRNEIGMANAAENYFDLHPQAVLTCDTCTDRTCMCPQGIDIPLALGRVHGRMHELRRTAQHPGPSAALLEKTIEGRHRVLVQTSDVPSRLGRRATGVARFLIQNLGDNRWMASQHTPDPSAAVGIGVVFDDRLATVVPLRNTVCPGEVSPLAFEFRAPANPGVHTVGFCLMPLPARRTDEGTVFHSGTVTVEPDASPGPSGERLRRRVARLLRDGLAKARGRIYAPSARAGPGPAYGAEYLEHSIPDRLKAGVTYGVRLTLVNTGALTWYAHPPDGRRVDLLVFVDDTLLAVLQLPQAEVAPGQQVTWHFPFRAHDDEGPHRVRVELVHQGVTRFSDQRVEPWNIDVHVVSAPMTESVRLHEISRKHNPWYYNPLTGIPESRDGHPFPLFISRAKGCRAWDAEGNEFLDYTMGWGSTILGHADDRIQDAIRQALDGGAVLPFPHPVEMEVSRMLIEDFPSNDMVAFGKNGSDVCTIAARLARVTTKKKTILSCGFHGWQDFALDYFGFEDCGIPDRPQRCLHKFTFNDRAGFLALYDRHKDDLAAVMIEPAGPLVSDEEGLGGPADVEFLQMIADAARKVNALLIFDEIITGFRYEQGSVQKATGVIPDLTCLGKALASGMPLAALLGPYRLFLEHFHKTHFCATFRGEAYSLAAARAALEIYRSEPVADHIWRYGEALRRGIHDVCRQTSIAGECTGPPFRMAFIFREPDAARRQLKRTLLMQELLKERIITVTGMMLPSYAHDDEALQRTIAAFARALEVVAYADRRDDLHRHIELPLL
jgi:glutamate-1-semialdehyde aminotransferase/predicted aldo/keto reductase-like oxidoreductase